MNGSRYLAVSALIAGLGLASTAQAQTMYRCGNTFQDRPCDGGAPSRPAGAVVPSPPSTASRPAAAPGRPTTAAERPGQAAERQEMEAVSKSLHAQSKARKCIRLREVLAGRTSRGEAQSAHADMRELGCPGTGSAEFDAEKSCAEAQDRPDMFEACGTYASFDVPDAARSSAAAAKAAHAKDVEQIHRDIDKAVERDLASFRQRCARGEQEYCVQATCLKLAVDDSEANLIACTRARGYRVGNGWVADDHGQTIPGVPRPDWSIGVTCMRKVGGIRPTATIWRKFGVPESAFDLEAEAAKACQAKYAEAQGQGRRR